MFASLSRFSRTDKPFSLSDRAYLLIRNRILKGELSPGAALSRRRLAKELEMSLLPVAEALQRLEGEGLVESRPRVGTRVCLPTPQDVREHYQVREALESQAARLFSEKATAEEKREVGEMAEHMDELFDRCSALGGAEVPPDFLYEVQDYHVQLHLRIAECTGCRALCQTIERNHVLVFNWLYDVAASRPSLPPRFHQDLVAAISAGDPEEADRAMRQHVRYGLDNVLRGIAGLDPSPRPLGSR
jgi:DNA-binding GntR family transcriptional regulator